MQKSEWQRIHTRDMLNPREKQSGVDATSACEIQAGWVMLKDYLRLASEVLSTSAGLAPGEDGDGERRFVRPDVES